MMLLNRHDTKFVLNYKQFMRVLKHLPHSYKVLEIDNNRLFSYESLYYDTKDLKFYHDHHNGKLNRYKIRYRRYVDADKYFFEIKYKTNKKRTQKNRMKKHGFEDHINGGADKLIDSIMDMDANDFHPQLLSKYKRITLVNIQTNEKVTIDLDISFESGDRSESVDNLIIAEVKLDQNKGRSEFIDLVKTLNIRQIRISKYCLGTVLTNDNIKYNRFKEKLIQIKKVCKS